ncbi:MAG: FAD-dependent oxidoreductase, partial [Planctomycetota bacterium]
MECIQRNGPEAPRHLVEFSSLEHDGGTSDVLVIGAGVAGLAAALSAARDGVSVRVLSKAALPETNTAYAQGGIAAVLGRDERSGGDSVERHVRDTLQAGGGFCDEEAVRSIVGGAGEAIAFLRGLGCRFDAGADGQVALTREGGHSQRRILHAAGDATGREIGRALLLAARSEDAIELREHCFVIDLLRHGGRVVGALACDDSGRLHLLRARQVIL